MTLPFLRRHTLLLAATAVLAACSSAPPRVFTLAAAPGVPTDGQPVVAAVAPVEIPKYLDRPQIVRRADVVELGVDEYERWGEPFANMVQRVLAEDLTGHLPGGSIVTASRSLSGGEAPTVELTLNRFDPDVDGAVVLEAQWRLRHKDGSRSDTRTYRIVHRSADRTASNEVLAMSDTLDELAGEIARGLY